MKVYLVKWADEGSWIVLASSGEEAVRKFVEASDDWDEEDEDALEVVEVEMDGGVSASCVEDMRAR